MGAGNMLLGRIFGKSAITDGGNNLSDIIINQQFIVLEKDPIITEELPKDSETIPDTLPSTSQADNEESSPTDEEKRIPILPMDISLISHGENFIYNDTSLSPNIPELSSRDLKKFSVSSFPLVLVIHTHTTESYMPEGIDFYVDDGSELARSNDVKKNMIAVGAEFTRILIENGIPTLHCTIVHDKDSYRESYSRAAESIAKYLEEYPSIRYVFDLHRDSLLRSTGELISAVSYIEGETYAQIMPVVGSGFSGWEDNMSFALRLRSKLNGKFTNLCRPVCLRESNYNQGMSSVSLLIEIGTSGNTLNEAKKAAAITAAAIADIIKYQN
jgi:stage II sporulation protein P